MTIPIQARLVLILMAGCNAALAQTYQPAASPVPFRTPSIVGDFDGDGFRDLLDLPAICKGDGNGNFLPRQVLPLIGALPQPAPSFSSAVADFDGNGYDDLIIRSNSSSLAAYAFGPGGAVQVPFPPGAILGLSLADALYRVVAADLDSDGLTDFVVTSLTQGPTLYFGVPSQPRAFRNLGGGAFATFPMASLTTAATHTFVIDADADGRLDIVVLQDPAVFGVTPSAPIVVIRQDSPGTFNSVVTSSVMLASFWSDAAIGDVDGDGLPDLYVSRQGSSTLFLNAGGGAFATAPTPGLTSVAPGVEVRLLDVNQDGDAELVTFENGDRLSVHDFVNGGFVGPIQVIGPALETLGLPTTVALARPTAADVDLDGRVDLVSFTTGLMLNDGHGGFRQVVDRLALGLDSGVHRLADLDGDGFPDILAVVRRRLSVGLNDGSARWTLAAANVPVLPAVTNDSASFTQPFDFDGDGDLDLYFANTSVSVPALAGPDLVLRNDGNLTWSSLFTRPSYGDVTAILPLDLDGDQDQDLVLVRSTTSNPPLVALINAGGISLVPQTLWQPNSQIMGCVAFDMEPDGDQDLFVTTFPINGFPPVLQTTVLVNAGNGSFTPLAGFPQVRGRPFAADFDGDGLTDLLAGGTVIRNAGGGSFTTTTIWAPATLVVPRGVTDVDHDGDLDLVLTLSSELRIFANDGAGGFTVVESSPYLGPEYPALPVPMDLDRDGDTEIDYHLFDVSHQLARTTFSRIGRPSTKRLSAAPGTAFSLYLSFGRTDLALPPYGTLFLDLASATEIAQGVTGANATADVSIFVPNLPALVGLAGYWQAVFWDGPRLSGLEATAVNW